MSAARDIDAPGSAAYVSMRRPTVLAPVLLALVVLAGGLAVGRAATAAPTGPPTFEIQIRHSHYDPSFLSVPVGRPVRFIIHNDDPIEHEWIVGDAAVHAAHRTGTELHHDARPTEVSIPALGMVTTIVTFADRGTLKYICHLPGHEAYGMVGTLDIR